MPGAQARHRRERHHLANLLGLPGHHARQTELGFDAEYDIPAAVTDFVGWYRRLKGKGS